MAKITRVPLRPQASKRPSGGGCLVHHVHVPKVWDLDVHHIHPLGEGGPDTPENCVAICPTGHRNIHELIRLYLAQEPMAEAYAFFSPREQELAARGYALIMTARRAKEALANERLDPP